jgi:hypothetical protein
MLRYYIYVAGTWIGCSDNYDCNLSCTNDICHPKANQRSRFTAGPPLLLPPPKTLLPLFTVLRSAVGCTACTEDYAVLCEDAEEDFADMAGKMTKAKRDWPRRPCSGAAQDLQDER